MGFPEVLTLIFVVLKLAHVLSWSWWIVFLPVILEVALSLLILGGTLVFAGLVAYFGSK